MGSASFTAYARRNAHPDGLKERFEGGRRILEQAYGPWPSAEVAMEHLGEQDRHENGHMHPNDVGGKHGLVHIATVDDLAEAQRLANELMDSQDGRISDRRGPAGCITIREGDMQFMFFGWVAT